MHNVKWIKLIVGMFDGASFKKIKRAKIDGVADFRDKLTAVWFELLDLGAKVNNEGLFINDEIAYKTYEDIAIMLDRTEKEIELCMNWFIKEQMIVIIDDVYSINNWIKYQNNDGLEKIREQGRIRQQNFRERRKMLIEENTNNSGNVTVTLRNANTLISNSLSNSNYISNNSLKDLKEDNNILDNNESGKSGGKNYHKSIEYRDKSIIDKDIKEDSKEDKRFKKPTIEEIKEYCIERNNNIDAEQFFNFYESKGWLVGKNSMKDWKASVRTWEKRNQDKKEERKELDYGDIFKGKYEV